MQTINPLVVSVGPSADATPIYPTQPTEHGGGVKKVIAVAAAVIIPVAAPAIASSIAASGVLGATVSAAMATTTGAVVSSAIVGAGLGAVTAKVTGAPVKAGAIMGAIGGGIGGYGSAQAGTFGTPQGGVSATADKYLGTNFSDATATTTTTPSGEIVDASTGTGDATLVKTGGVEVGTGEVVEKTFMEKMAEVPSLVAERISDPKNLADMTIRAGSQLMATALIPPDELPELSAQEQANLEAYTAELADLKAKDEAAFNAKMDAAKQYLVQAGYYSPEYFGLQAANTTLVSEAKKKREADRIAGLTDFRSTGRRSAQSRRDILDTSRNVASSYDKGFQTGMSSRDKAISTANQMIPTSSPNYANALANMGNYYTGLRERQDKARDNATNLFAGLFATGTGNTKEEKEELTKLGGTKKNTGGLNTDGMATGGTLV